jgi:hypothetical protein
MAHFRFIAILVVIEFLLGCQPANQNKSWNFKDPGKADADYEEFQYAQLSTLNLLNNSYTQTDTLTNEVGVSQEIAKDLIGHRDGPDGISDTGDDELFQSLNELEELVDEASLQKIVDYAANGGYGDMEKLQVEINIPTGEGLWCHEHRPAGHQDRVDFSITVSTRIATRFAKVFYKKVLDNQEELSKWKLIGDYVPADGKISFIVRWDDWRLVENGPLTIKVIAATAEGLKRCDSVTLDVSCEDSFPEINVLQPTTNNAQAVVDPIDVRIEVSNKRDQQIPLIASCNYGVQDKVVAYLGDGFNEFSLIPSEIFDASSIEDDFPRCFLKVTYKSHIFEEQKSTYVGCYYFQRAKQKLEVEAPKAVIYDEDYIWSMRDKLRIDRIPKDNFNQVKTINTIGDHFSMASTDERVYVCCQSGLLTLDKDSGEEVHENSDFDAKSCNVLVAPDGNPIVVYGGIDNDGWYIIAYEEEGRVIRWKDFAPFDDVARNRSVMWQDELVLAPSDDGPSNKPKLSFFNYKTGLYRSLELDVQTGNMGGFNAVYENGDVLLVVARYQTSYDGPNEAEGYLMMIERDGRVVWEGGRGFGGVPSFWLVERILSGNDGTLCITYNLNHTDRLTQIFGEEGAILYETTGEVVAYRNGKLLYKRYPGFWGMMFTLKDISGGIEEVFWHYYFKGEFVDHVDEIASEIDAQGRVFLFTYNRIVGDDTPGTILELIP